MRLSLDASTEKEEGGRSMSPCSTSLDIGDLRKDRLTCWSLPCGNFPTSLPKSRQRTRAGVILGSSRPRGWSCDSNLHENFQPTPCLLDHALDLLPGFQAASDGLLRFFLLRHHALARLAMLLLSLARLVWRLTAVEEKIFSSNPSK